MAKSQSEHCFGITSSKLYAPPTSIRAKYVIHNMKWPQIMAKYETNTIKKYCVTKTYPAKIVANYRFVKCSIVPSKSNNLITFLKATMAKAGKMYIVFFL